MSWKEQNAYSNKEGGFMAEIITTKWLPLGRWVKKAKPTKERAAEVRSSGAGMGNNGLIGEKRRENRQDKASILNGLKNEG